MTNPLMRTHNTMGGDKPRLADDAYFTPDALALAICRKLAEHCVYPEIVVEPSAGTGAFVHAAKRTWPDSYVFGVEPNMITDSALVSSGADATCKSTWEGLNWSACDIAKSSNRLIVGNPPFSLAEEHIALSMERLGHREAAGLSPSYLCFLLRASMLAGAGRYASLYGPQGLGGLKYVWHVVGRPSFTGKGQDAAEYAVLVWQAGHRGAFEGGWIADWKKPIAGGGR